LQPSITPCISRVGLLRQASVDGSKTYFDTNTTDHYHYYIEDSHQVTDIRPELVAIGKVPEPPEGYEIARVDVVVRLRRKARRG